MIVSCRLVATALAALGALAVASQAGWAQGYPDRNIKLIVPFAAGGNADINGRVVADVVQRALGQPVVVENRAGAGGGVGAEYVVRAEPDGYTLLVGSNGPLTINPIINPNVSYDPLKDFAAVALVSYVPHVLVVSNKLGVKSIPELVALSKTRPINLATSGVGSATHMTLERFKHATGAQIAHVPYKSGGSLLPDVISGNVDGAMTELSTAGELHKGGEVRIVAVAGATRSKLAPDIPTFDEQGVKGFVARSFIGIVAPAKAPAEALAKLQAAIAKRLGAGSEAAAKLIATGSEIATPEQMTPKGFADFIKRDYEDMQAAAKLAGLGK
jgi:tripartite-type tricarboxylate transporter receptor subunit TctC